MSEGSESRQNDGPTAAAEALDSAGAELDDMPDCDDAVIKVLTYQGRPKEGPHHPQLIGPWRPAIVLHALWTDHISKPHAVRSTLSLLYSTMHHSLSLIVQLALPPLPVPLAVVKAQLVVDRDR